MATAIVKSVEFFEVAMTTSETSQTATLTKGQDITNCVPFFHGQCQSTTLDNMRAHNIDVWFTSTDTLNIAREQTTTTAHTSMGYVVEFDDSVVTVQSGTFSLSGATATATISSVTLADSFAIAYGEAAAANDPDDNMFRTGLDAMTTVGFERDGTTGTIDGHWFVVEYSGFTTQDVSATITGTTQDTMISEVVLADTFIWSEGEFEGVSNFPGAVGQRAELTTTTNLHNARDNGLSTAFSRTQVVECDDNEFVTQDGNLDMATLGSTEAISISAIDEDGAMATSSARAYGKTAPGISDEADINMAYVRMEFTTSSEITVTIGEAHTGAGTITWYATDWELVATGDTGAAMMMGCNF